MFTMSVFMHCYNYFTGIIFTITVIFQMTIIVDKKFQYRPSLFGRLFFCLIHISSLQPSENTHPTCSYHFCSKLLILHLMLIMTIMTCLRAIAWQKLDQARGPETFLQISLALKLQ